ncbi:Uncharacterised protein [Candidatus Tiddalikarchaeum anstoanum]|nr:Uncharacterised protein [Candidatus Tiddalikarchaeum anstoanum]
MQPPQSDNKLEILIKGFISRLGMVSLDSILTPLKELAAESNKDFELLANITYLVATSRGEQNYTNDEINKLKNCSYYIANKIIASQFNYKENEKNTLKLIREYIKEELEEAHKHEVNSKVNEFVDSLCSDVSRLNFSERDIYTSITKKMANNVLTILDKNPDIKVSEFLKIKRDIIQKKYVFFEDMYLAIKKEALRLSNENFYGGDKTFGLLTDIDVINASKQMFDLSVNNKQLVFASNPKAIKNELIKSYNSTVEEKYQIDEEPEFQ